MKEIPTAPRYLSPALEKGLDVLELLAGSRSPLTFASIMKQLGRSQGEIYRIVQVLKSRDFIVQASLAEGFSLSDRLLALGMYQPQSQGLLEISLPVMRELSGATGDSCYLAVHSRGEVVVLARVEGGEQPGFSVRSGHRTPLLEAASGAVLYAFQSDDVKRKWEDCWLSDSAAGEIEALRRRAEGIREQGAEVRPSRTVAGVIDISVPILRGSFATAALTMPFVQRLQDDRGGLVPVDAVRAASNSISSRLRASDDAV